MNNIENVIAVFIPIVLFLVAGIILLTMIFFRSRERQVLIDKGLDPQSIKEFFESKKDPYRLMKIGTIIFAFGLGLGIGLILQDATEKNYWIPLLIFTFTGIGFMIANKYSIKNKDQNS